MFCLTECPLFGNVALCCLVTVTVLSLKFIGSCPWHKSVKMFILTSLFIYCQSTEHFPLWYCHVLAQQHWWYTFLLCDPVFHEADEYMCWLSTRILFSIDISIDKIFHRHIFFAGTYLEKLDDGLSSFVTCQNYLKFVLFT